MGQHHIGASGAIQFYKDLTNAKTMVNMPDSELREKISLIVTITNCEGSEYSFKAFDVTTQPSKLLDTSEVSRPNGENVVIFQKTFIMEYFFEKDQQILLSIFKNKSGEQIKMDFKSSIGSIVGSRQNTLTKKINSSDPENISITAIEMKDNMEYLSLDFDIRTNKPLNFTESRNYIYYLVEGKTNLYKSETISADGKLLQARIPINLLKPQFKLTVFDCKQKPVARIQTTIEEFTTPNGTYKEIFFPLSKHRSMTLVNKSAVRKSYTFIDYLKNGVQLGLVIAIDFTGSNGHPNDQGSLHQIGPGIINDYERAISSCGSIVAYYDYDQQFPVFGFGAILPGEPSASMCFNVNSLDSPDIYSIPGVLEAYHKKVMEITFSGPTYFAPVLRETINIIHSQKNNLQYQVLMILTDGIINDMNETIDLLVMGAKLPLSVIIIGIGNADFSNMEILDADDNPLVSSTGEKCVRDLVQFVPFSKFEHNQQRLAEEVLEEVPRQILEYYTQNNMYPETLNQ